MGCNYLDEYAWPYKSGDVAILSRKGQEILQNNPNHAITAKGYTIFQVDRDDKYLSKDLRDVYLGDHHYVVLPCLEIQEMIL